MYKSWRKSRTLKPDFDNENPVICKATKFFDQLSFIGDEIVGCFVLETAKGYVLFDCMNPDERSKNIIKMGFENLGFDLNQLYAIIISHGHGDHFGNAGYFKEKYGTKIYMSEIDYKFASNLPDTLPWESVSFEVNHYLKDKEYIDFGDTKIYTSFTPGHSEGCFSFIIPVSDEGVKHHVALWGGSGILPGSDKEAYYHSLLKFSKECQDHHVDGEIATHPCLDMGLQRLEIVRNIVDGVPNPFVIGEDGYKYYERQFYNLVREYWDK